MRFATLLLLVGLSAAPCWGQGGAESNQATTAKFRLGLFGFGVQAGIDFAGDDQLIFGSTLDLGDLFTDRVRMRLSGELGTGSDADTYVISPEVTFRLVPDTVFAVPYLGGGIGLFSQEGCGDVEGCPALWLQFAIGFEIDLREPIRWLVEYHGENSFKQHRLLVGLTTRRGR
jgi:hypothetical protein